MKSEAAGHSPSLCFWGHQSTGLSCEIQLCSITRSEPLPSHFPSTEHLFFFLIFLSPVLPLSKLEASHGCQKVNLHNEAFPLKQACGSPTKHRDQQGPSSSEAITADIGLETRRPFKLMAQIHICHSIQYRLRQQRPDLTLCSRELL